MFCAFTGTEVEGDVFRRLNGAVSIVEGLCVVILEAHVIFQLLLHAP